jgi:hypothetical protein
MFSQTKKTIHAIVPKKTRMTKARARCLAAVASFAVVALPSIASAQTLEARVETRPERLDEPSLYPIEIEPHFTFGAENVYGATGFGAGLRVGIPLAAGHLGDIPQNVAISFGGDLLHYDNCYYGTFCSANYLMVPVAAQWNVFVARRVSLFAEGGVFVYKGWFDECGGNPGCSAPSDFGLLPTIAIGGRVHLGRDVALTLRLGYPTSTLGVSFM